MSLARIGKLVTAATTADDVKRSKPCPDVFLAILEKLDRPAPGEVIVVGDSPYDAEAAAKAGIRTVGLLSGGFSRYELTRAGCIALYDNPEDLCRNFERSALLRDR